MTSYLRRKRVPTRDINLGVPVVSTTGASSLKSLAIWRGVVFVAFIVGMMAAWGVALADLDDGLVAHYPFNGNANDESGNGNDGTVNGATLTEDRFGNADSAYDFDGQDDNIEIVSGPNLQGSSQTSLLAWFKSDPSKGTGNSRIIEIGGGPSNGTALVLPTGAIAWIHADGARKGQISSSGGTPNDDEWHFLAFTYDGSTTKLYMDGLLNSSDSASGVIDSPPVASIGFYESHVFGGVIDDIRVYNRALSECEIKSLYTGEDECDEPPVGCSDGPATYSNETRQAILPCVEIPLYTDINGSPINITGLYSAVLEIPFGFSDFEAKELTFLEIIDESNPTHARFNPDTGILDIPRIDVPTTVPLLVGGTIPGPVLQCSAKLQQSALRAEVLMLQEFDCNLP